MGEMGRQLRIKPGSAAIPIAALIFELITVKSAGARKLKNLLNNLSKGCKFAGWLIRSPFFDISYDIMEK